MYLQLLCITSSYSNHHGYTYTYHTMLYIQIDGIADKTYLHAAYTQRQTNSQTKHNTLGFRFPNIDSYFPSKIVCIVNVIGYIYHFMNSLTCRCCRLFVCESECECECVCVHIKCLKCDHHFRSRDDER